jgi:hypothetical protein
MSAHCLAFVLRRTARSSRRSFLGQRAVLSILWLACRVQRAGALFGVRFNGVGARHPLAEGGSAANLTPICIQRRDRGFLVQRGGGHMELESKRVLLLGCGSVGGHLAFLLARAGIGALTLVDHDIFTAENTYRHVLGKPYWGKLKALAMQQALMAQLPFINVQAIPKTIETAFVQDLIRLSDFDLIVSALGNPTSELALNERVRRAVGPPIVVTWLDRLASAATRY